MSKRKLSDDLSSSMPSLLQLSCSAFARSLWQQKLKFSRLPEESSHVDQPFLENCKLQILAFLKENFPHIDDLSKVTISQQVNLTMDQMIDEFSSLTLPHLMRHVFETKKWRDFTFSIWSCLKNELRLVSFVRMFTWITTRINEEGFDALPGHELSMYLELWNEAPKDYKITTIDRLSQLWDYSTANSLHYQERETITVMKRPRDIRFLQKLFFCFDFAERTEIWRKNWIRLIVDVSATDLDPLMRMFCEKHAEFEQFKTEWLSRDKIIKDYYCRLIKIKGFRRLDELLNFYSSDESKIMELAVRILRVQFSICALPINVRSTRSGYKKQMIIAQAGGWLGKAIKMPEFEHLFVKDVTKMRLHYYTLMHRHDLCFDEINEFLKFILPEEEVIFYERQFLRSYFLHNNYPVEYMNCNHFQRFCFIDKLDKFKEYVNRIFPTIETAANFKKEILFATYTMENLLDYWRSAWRPSYLKPVCNFVAWCLPCEQDLNEWKKVFASFIIRTLRKAIKNNNITSVKELFSADRNILSWCLNSQHLVDEFKTSITIDEIFLILTDDCGGLTETHISTMNDILKWWYASIEDIVDFKLNKMREFPNDRIKIVALLGVSDEDRRAFSDCTTDSERRAVITRITQQEKSLDS